jgi:hypothetical protein
MLSVVVPAAFATATLYLCCVVVRSSTPVPVNSAPVNSACMHASLNHRLVRKIHARLQFLSSLTLVYGIVTINVTQYPVSLAAPQ